MTTELHSKSQQLPMPSLPNSDQHLSSTYSFLLHSHLTQQVTAATFGSCLTAIFTCPLDVIKSRLQTHHMVRSIPHRFIPRKHHHAICTGQGNMHSTSHSPSSYEALVSIVRSEGVATLWRGLRPTLLMSIPNNGLYYSLYERMKVEFSGLGSTWTPLFAGCVARTVAVTVTSPFEFFKTANQVSKKRVYLRDLQWKQLMRGWSATLLRDVPFSSIYWMLYENLKHELLRSELFLHNTLDESNQRPQNLVLISFISGAVGGMVACTLTHPMDVIKTNAQNVESRHNGIWSLAKDMFREQGLKGFTRGLTPRVLKVAPSCAIMISTYELVKHLMEKVK